MDSPIEKRHVHMVFQVPEHLGERRHREDARPAKAVLTQVGHDHQGEQEGAQTDGPMLPLEKPIPPFSTRSTR